MAKRILLAALLGLAVTASPAAAIKNPYTATGVCGAGYSVIDRHKLYDTHPDGRRIHLADMVLTYNTATGKNCAVTMKRFRVGKPDYMWISIQTRRAGDGNSAQNLQYFAGPSYVFARHRCIVWHGGAELDVTYHHAHYTLYDAWRSKWSHCS